jgi:hypothetical protein
MHSIAANLRVGIAKSRSKGIGGGRVGVANVPKLEHRLAANLRPGMFQIGYPRAHVATSRE